ncbi:MAG: glutathione S-transferase domain-containing protein [Actinomycetota bacterium]|nr:glutathione S-transferase domain-containing protein [Actinomycetota bacterium]
MKDAGHSPDVVKVYSLASLPDLTAGRKEVKRLTGESFVPVLVLDDGQVIRDSRNIVDWARSNPAGPT